MIVESWVAACLLSTLVLGGAAQLSNYGDSGGGRRPQGGGGAGPTGSSKIPFGKIGGSLKSLATDTIKSTAGNLAANLDVKSTAKKAVSKARQFFFSKKKKSNPILCRDFF